MSDMKAAEMVDSKTLRFEGRDYIDVGRCGECAFFEHDTPPILGWCVKKPDAELAQTERGYCNYWKEGKHE